MEFNIQNSVHKNKDGSKSITSTYPSNLHCDNIKDNWYPVTEFNTSLHLHTLTPELFLHLSFMKRTPLNYLYPTLILQYRKYTKRSQRELWYHRLILHICKTNRSPSTSPAYFCIQWPHNLSFTYPGPVQTCPSPILSEEFKWTIFTQHFSFHTNSTQTYNKMAILYQVTENTTCLLLYTITS